jgi:SNF2 family DNA or RNA helicase
MPIEMKLYPFQQAGVEWLAERPRAILADSFGCGKTAQIISAIKRLGLTNVLVVCPKQAHGVWEEEIRKWDRTSYMLIVHGSRAKRRSLLCKWITARYTIINYELMRIHYDDLFHRWDAIVFDEAHKLKNRKSKTLFKRAKQIVPLAKRVYFLSATPLVNHASDFWTLLHLIDRKQFSSFWKYANTYCKIYFNGFAFEVIDIDDEKDPRVDLLRKALEPYLLRRTKIEVFPEMPKMTVQKVWIELDKKQRGYYQQMEKEFFTELRSGKVVSAALAIARMTRLRQLAIDPDLMIDEEGTRILKGAKITTLLELIDGLQGKKFVVFSDYARVLKKLSLLFDKLSIAHSRVFGSQSARITTEEVARFTSDTKCQACLATIQKGGQSISLTVASTAFFLSKHWTPALNRQAQGRLDRHGQKEPVTIVELLTKNTVEEHIEKVLKEKKKITDLIVDYKRIAEGRD